LNGRCDTVGGSEVGSGEAGKDIISSDVISSDVIGSDVISSNVTSSDIANSHIVNIVSSDGVTVVRLNHDSQKGNAYVAGCVNENIAKKQGHCATQC
jgi:hypothetical protein